MLEEFTKQIVLNFMQEGRLADTITFFIYDSIKIIFLLAVMIAAISYLRTYVPPSKIKAWLSKGKYGSSNLVASFLGAATPFCSCSSIPLFLSMLKAGVPIGTAFSFIITSPILNEYLVVIMLTFFGWKITVAYAVLGIAIGTLSGLILGKMNIKHLIEEDFKNNLKDEVFKTQKARLKSAYKETLKLLKKLWYWVVAAVALGALIHNYVPENLIHNLVAKTGALGVPLAVILGVPMYASCAAIIPVAFVLFSKGIPLGTTLAFMMATSALSFPEAIILRRAMKLKLIGIFFGIVTIGIIVIGYVMNILQPFMS